MKKIRIGVLGTSEIAYRRFLPALIKHDKFEFVGVASRDIDKTLKFIERFGGRGYDSYDSLISDYSVCALYIPLPPALHYLWAKKTVEYGKHVLLEKPFTTSLADTEDLIAFSQKNNTALHENYMFQFHSQISSIKKLIVDKVIGEVRLYRIAFGFPKRKEGDFRYSKEMGDGAFLDCGGYTLKLASDLLGDGCTVATSMLNYIDGHNVDIFGSATIINSRGETCQLSFGMDNSYKCEMEVWGSQGVIYTDRIFTAPVGYKPLVTIKNNLGVKTIELEEDDTFYKSIDYFYNCIVDEGVRSNSCLSILTQAKFSEKIIGGMRNVDRRAKTERC